MTAFTYTALDANGAERTGRLEALDVRNAATTLKRQGLFPLEIIPARAPVARAERRFALPFVRIAGPRELAAFTRQLGTLVHAGMPLLRGLEVLARQEKNAALRRVIESLAEVVRTGGTLSDAMKTAPRVFDRLYVNMIRAGEAGGVLDVVLERLARFQEKSLQLRGKIRAALAYPLIVLAVSAGILAGLLVFVVPKFRRIFADLLKGAPLPPLTRAVMTLSEAVQHHALLVAGGVAALVVAARILRRTPAGSQVSDALMLKLPLFGDLVLKAVVARASRTFGTLLASGVPILPALTIAHETCGNRRVAGALAVVHDRVKAGAAVARPLEATAVFPPLVVSMIEVGEQSGQLPAMLGRIADIYEEEVDSAVAGLSALVEPLLILFLALVVGTIVIALFLPIIRIVQLLT